jgi:Glycosyltransferase family 87
MIVVSWILANFWHPQAMTKTLATGVPAAPLPRFGFAALLPSALAGEDRIAFRDLMLFAGAMFALSIVAHACTITWTETIPRDGTSLVIGRDFLNLWMYGRAATSADPGQFYDLATYRAALRDLLGMELLGPNWSYPPSVMFLAAPFGKMGYLTALLCWTLIGIAVFCAVARRHVSDWRILFPVLISPAALFCLISGQSSFLTAAVLLAIFASLDRKPVVAGVLIGLLTLKPQLGILFPFMLIASNRWRVFAVAAVTSLVIAVATAVVFGPQVWVDFVMKGLPVQAIVLADADRIATPFFPTVFMNLRGLNASYQMAMAVQAVFSATALGAVVWAFRYRRTADPVLMMALFLACSVTASPYLLAYDLLPMAIVAVILLATARLDAPGRRFAQLVYWTPALQLAFGGYHIPGPALIVPAFAAYLLVQLARSPATVPNPGSPAAMPWSSAAPAPG